VKKGKKRPDITLKPYSSMPIEKDKGGLAEKEDHLPLSFRGEEKKKLSPFGPRLEKNCQGGGWLGASHVRLCVHLRGRERGGEGENDHEV